MLNYLTIANLYAKESKATRAKVGAVCVTTTNILVPGYNGTPIGTNNSCEDMNGKTHPWVLHAEENCILKAAQDGISLRGSTLYVTLAPCLHCAAMIKQVGIKEVWYEKEYDSHNGTGVQYLNDNSVHCKKDYRSK